MARGAAAYQEVEVTSRSPLELVVMLYDGALGALRRAQDALQQRDLVTKRSAVQKSLQILHHLQSTLNMDEGGEIAANLDLLYGHIISRVLDANASANPAPLTDAIRLLDSVREVWAQVASAPTPDDPRLSLVRTPPQR
jgi:flagellar protein FliS